MKRHRIDRNETVYRFVRYRERYIITKCGFAFHVTRDRYLMTNRWDATTCKLCWQSERLEMPKVDYSQIEEMDFSPIDEGTYDAVLTGWELKDGDKGQYYNCEFTIDESEEEAKNRKVWTIMSLAPKALWRFKRDMIRLGADGEDMAPGSEVDTDDIIARNVGASCRLKLIQETYESNDGEEKIRNTIKEVMTPAALPF